MKRRILLLVTCLGLIGAVAGAVGVDSGTYKPYEGEKEPADITEGVRIVPPPLGGHLTARIRCDRPRYHVGDSIRINFGVNRDSYVFIFNTDSNGQTNQIYPNYYDRSNFLRAGKNYFIPDRGYDLEVTPPAGNNTLTVVAVLQDYGFLEEWRRYTRQDPYPATREGAAGLVRRIESFRIEPHAWEQHALRPVPREDLWADDTTTFYVMDQGGYPPPDYRVPRWGSLDVDTYPSNARIYIDAEYHGRSPQTINRIEPGYHRIRLTKEGYVPYECNFTIKANEMKDFDIFLKTTPDEPGYSKSGKAPINGQGWGFFSPTQ